MRTRWLTLFPEGRRDFVDIAARYTMPGARPAIYRMAMMRAKEETARANLRRELASLS